MLLLEGREKGHRQGRNIEKGSIVAVSAPGLLESIHVDKTLAEGWGIHHCGLR